MQTYTPNSPEAMARILAMMIVTDAHVDDREIAILDRLDAYAIIGISRNDFMRVARDYCSQLVGEAEEHGETPLLDADRADRIIDCVEVPARRLLVARLLLAVLAADQQQRKSELVLYDHILDRWGISRDDVVSTLEISK
jgi:uncharacterized tellurite resistance protein B-like protein